MTDQSPTGLPYDHDLPSFDKLVDEATSEFAAYKEGIEKPTERLYRALELAYRIQVIGESRSEDFDAYASAKLGKVTKATRKAPFMMALRLVFGSDQEQSPDRARYSKALSAVRTQLNDKGLEEGAVVACIKAQDGKIDGLVKQAKAANQKDPATDHWDFAEELPLLQTLTVEPGIGNEGDYILFLGRMKGPMEIDILAPLHEPQPAIDAAVKRLHKSAMRGQGRSKELFNELGLPDIADVYRLGENTLPPVLSPLSYAGSKRMFRDMLSEWIPSGMLEYREPFFGAGNVYFNFAERIKASAKTVLLNEFNRGIFCYWLKVRDEPQKLWAESQKLLASTNGDIKVGRQLSSDLYDTMENGSEMEAAIATAVANHICFSGTMKKGSFSQSDLKRGKPSREHRILKCSQLLQGVEITNEDFHSVFERPGDGVFMVVDPPYDDTAGLYKSQMDYEVFLKDLIETNHSWLVTHSATARHKRRVMWAKLMGQSNRFFVQWYEMGHGVGVKTNDLIGEETRADGTPLTAADLRLELLIANYHPEDGLWKALADIARPVPAEPIDWAAVEQQIRDGEGEEPKPHVLKVDQVEDDPDYGWHAPSSKRPN